MTASQALTEVVEISAVSEVFKKDRGKLFF